MGLRSSFALRVRSTFQAFENEGGFEAFADFEAQDEAPSSSPSKPLKPFPSKPKPLSFSLFEVFKAFKGFEGGDEGG